MVILWWRYQSFRARNAIETHIYHISILDLDSHLFSDPLCPALYHHHLISGMIRGGARRGVAGAQAKKGAGHWQGAGSPRFIMDTSAVSNVIE